MAAGKPCVFCEIARGERVAPVVYEDEAVLAFLDHRPLFPGHVLVVPRQHRETLIDLDPGEIAAVFGFARRVAAAVEIALGAEGSFVAVNNRVSQSVPHLHVHVVPRRRKDGLRGFFWPRNPYRDPAHVEEVRAALAEALESARGA